MMAVKLFRLVATLEVSFILLSGVMLSCSSVVGFYLPLFFLLRSPVTAVTAQKERNGKNERSVGLVLCSGRFTLTRCAGGIGWTSARRVGYSIFIVLSFHKERHLAYTK
jgi:hypothetical protein